MTTREQREALAEELAQAAMSLPEREEPCSETGYPPRICNCRAHTEARAEEFAGLLRAMAGL